MNIILRFMILFVIIFMPGCLFSIKFFNLKKFNPGERFLLYIIISLIILTFNMFLLIGKYALPYLSTILGFTIGFSLTNFYLLLLIEVAILIVLQYNRISYIKNNFKRLKDKFNALSIFLRRSSFHLFLVLIGFILIVTPHALAQSRHEQPATALVWYYHHLTVSVLENRVFPDTIRLYGEVVNFDATYVGYNLISGTFYSIINCDNIVYLKWMTFFPIVISFIFALAFINRLICFPYSLVGVVIIFFSKLFIYKLSTFRTEALAMGFMFAGLWIVHDALNLDDYKLLAVSGAIFAIGTSINSSLSLVSISIITSFTIINSLFERKFSYYFRKITIFFVLSLIITITIFFLSVGKIPVISTLLVQGGSTIQVSGDPTWGFLRALNPDLAEEPSFPDYLPNYVYSDFLNNSHLILFILFLSIVGIWRTDENNRKTLLSLQLFTAILFIIGIFFYKYYNTYVPARSGLSRIFPYTYIPLSLMTVVVIKNLPNITFFSKRFNRTIKIYYKPIILTSLTFIILLINTPFLEACHGSGVTSSGYKALVWLRENTDPNTTTVISNEWASGAGIGISRRNFLNDGDAPYLRSRELTSINSLLIKVREFYRNPLENIELLEEMKITHILVSYKRAFRGISILPDDEISEALLRGIGLRLVSDFNNIKIFDTEWLGLDLEENYPMAIYEGYTTFWSIFQGQSGNYNITFGGEDYDDEQNVGLRMTIGEGNYRRVGVVHRFPEIQDYSTKDFLCIYLRGEKSDNMIKIILYAPSGKNYYRYMFRDNFEGWARLIIPFNSFEQFGTPSWAQIKSIYIFFDTPLKTGTWYLGRVVTANYPRNGYRDMN